MSAPNEDRENAKQRMEGELHQFQLAEEAQALRHEKDYQEGRHTQITLNHDGPLTVALFAFPAGGRLHDHRVSGPISVQLLSGRIVFSTQTGGRVELEAGSLLSLTGGVTHSVEALEDSTMLLTVVQVGERAKQPSA